MLRHEMTAGVNSVYKALTRLSSRDVVETASGNLHYHLLYFEPQQNLSHA